MPILPLGHPEPFAATLGVMLYPGTDQDERRKALAFAAQWLGEPLRRFHEAGHRFPDSDETLLRIAVDGGYPLSDFEDRFYAGSMTGELFVTLFMLAAHDHHRTGHEHPLASWNNAARLIRLIANRTGLRAGRTNQWQYRKRFLSVAHLWGAWSLREGRFVTDLTVGYDGYQEFQSFLMESEMLRDFGQNWRPRRAKGKPPLSCDLWRVHDTWSPPQRQPGWPETGKIGIREVPEDLLAQLRPAGRPRKGL